MLDKHAKPLGPGETRTTCSAERDDPDTITRAKEWQATKKRRRLGVLTWPKEFGGRERHADPERDLEPGRGAVPTCRPNIFGIGQGMLGPTIMAHGTHEQKERYIEKMARGEEIWCQLFSEPAAGSDLAGLRTRR